MNRREFTKTVLGGALAPLFRQAREQREEFFYKAWSWDRWRTITGVRPPELATDQSGQWALSDLLRPQGKPIETTQAWEQERERLRQIILYFLGPPPRLKVHLKPRVLQEHEFTSHIRRKVVYQSEPGEVIPAYLLIPKPLREPAPAIVCLHQTTYAGKREAAGIEGDPALAFAQHLVERGYVTIAPDQICFGERHQPALGHYGDAIAFYRRHPRWSVAGKMIWDVGRTIDYLETLNVVDKRRLGCIGHSHGGYGTLWAAAFDERIRAAVVSCGFTTFRADGNVYRWSHATALIPRLGFYLQDARMTWETFQTIKVEATKLIPFDFHHLTALVAPRALFLSVALKDQVFPRTESVHEAVEKVRAVYRLYGVEEKLEAHFFDGPHEFPAEARERAYAWLDRQLKGKEEGGDSTVSQ